MLYNTLLTLLVAQTTTAQMFNFFNQHQHQQQQPKKTYEEEFLNIDCKKYLCPDTQTCVKSPSDCPCPFPSSQLKCQLPGTEGKFVCISKPATNDQHLIQLYDDPSRGPKTAVKGLRDCGWVIEAYKGLV
ncbi:hypothetical protein WICPIJ_008743 [Wickerhamomyces pijperi]|uniref:Long chronological lifespan protein 2 n=1 Tax=Wickerhamomyces pijperi TaxID=599730 RepID=A0A9P8PWQ8_WICPI|nr:hypothetical protein WICPIJ_008743 [Wickerhamomyces pijperi]